MTEVTTQSLLDERADLKAGMKPTGNNSFRGFGGRNTEIDATNIPAIDRLQEIEDELERREVAFD